MQNTNSREQVLSKLKEAESILITVSNNPSVDELASALALTLAINKMGKHATAVASGRMPDALKFLRPEKTFENSVDSLRDFIIALNKEKADHLRYKLVGDHVKIFITPYRTIISEKDLEFEQGDFNVDFVLALGVTNKDHLDNALSAHGRIFHDAGLGVITIGEEPSTLSDLNWHEKNASSISELVSELIESLDKKTLVEPVATALLTGIVAETERFSNSKVTADVMSLASKLIVAGADQQLIISKLKEAEDQKQDLSIDTAAENSENNTSKEDTNSLSVEHEKEQEENNSLKIPKEEQEEDELTAKIDTLKQDNNAFSLLEDEKDVVSENSNELSSSVQTESSINNELEPYAQQNNTEDTRLYQVPAEYLQSMPELPNSLENSVPEAPFVAEQLPDVNNFQPSSQTEIQIPQEELAPSVPINNTYDIGVMPSQSYAESQVLSPSPVSSNQLEPQVDGLGGINNFEEQPQPIQNNDYVLNHKPAINQSNNAQYSTPMDIQYNNQQELNNNAVPTGDGFYNNQQTVSTPMATEQLPSVDMGMPLPPPLPDFNSMPLPPELPPLPDFNQQIQEQASYGSQNSGNSIMTDQVYPANPSQFRIPGM